MEKQSQDYDSSFFPGIIWISCKEEKKKGADRFHKEKDDKTSSCQEDDKPKIIHYLHCGASMIFTQNIICKSSLKENLYLKFICVEKKRNCVA